MVFGLLLGVGFWLKYSWLAYAGAIGLTLLFALRGRTVRQVIRVALIVGAASMVPVVILFAINLHYTGHLTAQSAGAVPPVITFGALVYPLRSVLDVFKTSDGAEHMFNAFRQVLRFPISWDVLSVVLSGLMGLAMTYIFYRARRQFTENEKIVLLCGYLGWLLTYLLLFVNTLSGHGEIPQGDNLLIGTTRFYSHALLLLWICLIAVASRLEIRWRVLIVAAVIVVIILPNFVQESRRYPFFWNYRAGPSGLRTDLPSGADAQLTTELEPLLSHGNTIVLGQSSDLLFDFQQTERVRIWVTNVTNYDPQPICFEQPGRLIAVIKLDAGSALDATGIPVYTWRASSWMGIDHQLWHRLNPDENNGYALLEYGGDVPICSKSRRDLPEP